MKEKLKRKITERHFPFPFNVVMARVENICLKASKTLTYHTIEKQHPH